MTVYLLRASRRYVTLAIFCLSSICFSSIAAPVTFGGARALAAGKVIRVMLGVNNPLYYPALARRRVLVMGTTMGDSAYFDHLAIVDIDTGRFVARRVLDGPFADVDVAADADRAIIATARSVYVFRLSDGALLWRDPLPNNPTVVSMMADHTLTLHYDDVGGTIALANRNSCLILSASGHIIALVGAPGDLRTSVAPTLHLLLFTDSPPQGATDAPVVGTLTALDTRTGKVRWVRHYPNLVARYTADCCGGIDPILVDSQHDHVWTVNRGGRVTATSLATGRVVGVVHAETPIPDKWTQDEITLCPNGDCVFVEWRAPGRSSAAWDLASLRLGTRHTTTIPSADSFAPVDGSPYMALSQDESSSTRFDLYAARTGAATRTLIVPGIGALASDGRMIYEFGTITTRGADEVTGNPTETSQLVIATTGM